MVHMYHVKILQHIQGENKINLPYFFTMSLLKMIEGLNQKKDRKETSYYHQGLIRMMVEHQLAKKT